VSLLFKPTVVAVIHKFTSLSTSLSMTAKAIKPLKAAVTTFAPRNHTLTPIDADFLQVSLSLPPPPFFLTLYSTTMSHDPSLTRFSTYARTQLALLSKCYLTAADFMESR